VRIILLFVSVFAFGCNTASLPRNPKPANARAFNLMLNSYILNFNTIEAEFSATYYSEPGRAAMREVLNDVDTLDVQLGKESVHSSVATRIFWFNEYCLLLVDINDGYRDAIVNIRREFESLPAKIRGEFMEYHNHTLGFYELFNQLRIAPAQIDITADMGRLVSMVNSMAYLAKQVIT